MRVSDKAIVLQAIRHGDKKFIVKLFTEKNGLVTVVAAAGKSPTNKVRTATLLPLSLITCEYTLKQNRELHQLTESSCYFVGKGFGDSISKLSIAQFLNEVLINSIRDHAPNAPLFHFSETCLKYLQEAETNYVNLHLYFMLELSKHLGFEPHNNRSTSNCYFDCREGGFMSHALAYPLGLNKLESEFFSACLEKSILNTSFSYTERKLLLDILLTYFKLHLPGFNDIKSLEVLQTVLAQV